jgi:hypothetical protein
MLRMYWPDETEPSIIDGTWTMPALKKERHRSDLQNEQGRPRCISLKINRFSTLLPQPLNALQQDAGVSAQASSSEAAFPCQKKAGLSDRLRSSGLSEQFKRWVSSLAPSRFQPTVGLKSLSTTPKNSRVISRRPKHQRLCES